MLPRHPWPCLQPVAFCILYKGGLLLLLDPNYKHILQGGNIISVWPLWKRQGNSPPHPEYIHSCKFVRYRHLCFVSRGPQAPRGQPDEKRLMWSGSSSWGHGGQMRPWLLFPDSHPLLQRHWLITGCSLSFSFVVAKRLHFPASLQ